MKVPKMAPVWWKFVQKMDIMYVYAWKLLIESHYRENNAWDKNSDILGT